MFAQNPRWRIPDEMGIPPRPDLDVQWNVSTNKIPPTVAVYRMSPHDFTGVPLSNVLSICGLSSVDNKARKGGPLLFEGSKPGQSLEIWKSGEIRFGTKEISYSADKLASGVPKMSELPTLATNFLEKLCIPLPQVTGYFENEKFNFSEPLTMFYVPTGTVTNIAFRSVRFRRAVDGIPVAGGDSGAFDVGEKRSFRKIEIEWHNLTRVKTLPTISREKIIDVLKTGKAYQTMLSQDIVPFDWQRVKSVRINKAIPCYFSSDSNSLYPFLVLFSTVDTSAAVIDILLECPIVDESSL